MARDRKNAAAPIWIEKNGYWQLNKQYHGERKTFRSYIRGQRGSDDCDAQAKKWLTSKRREAAFWKDDNEIPYSISVKDLGQKWIEELKLSTSRDHWGQYESYLKNYVYPRYGVRRVFSLVEQDLQNIILFAFTHPADHHYKQLSHKTLKKIKGCLTSFLKYARKCGVSTLHPESLYIPKTAKKGQRFPLQPSDIRTLFYVSTTYERQKVREEWFIHAFRFAVIVGLRPGELAHLQDRRDIIGNRCFQRGAFNVRKEETSGKTENAVRKYILPKAAMKVIEDQREMLKNSGVISPYLFPGMNGDQLSYSTYKAHWYRYRDYNGLSQRTLYEMRHTYFAANKRIAPELLKIMAGQGESFDPFEFYGGEMDGDSEELAALVDDTLSALLENGESTNNILSIEQKGSK